MSHAGILVCENASSCLKEYIYGFNFQCISKFLTIRAHTHIYLKVSQLECARIMENAPNVEVQTAIQTKTPTYKFQCLWIKWPLII